MEAWQTTDIEASEVRLQLARMLKTSLFNQSRRYATLLSFVVEESLQGRGDSLKERTLGMTIFNRDPAYDTSQDPVVRVTMAEIRKRIAQYYHDDTHETELRIEVPAGHYIAEFRPAKKQGMLPDSSISSDDQHVELQPQQHGSEPNHQYIDSHQQEHHHFIYSRPLIITSATSVGVLLGLLIAVLISPALSAVHPSSQHQTHSFLDDFWSEMLVPGKQVTICLPTEVGKHRGALTQAAYLGANDKTSLRSKSEPQLKTFLDHEVQGENVVFSDAMAGIRVANMLTLRNQSFRVRLNTATTLEDLREGPAVLIGGLDNQWTLEAIAPLRYRFAGSDEEGYWISDAQDSSNRQWSLDLKQEYTKITHDYALIAIVHDEQTGKPQVVVAGIGMSGTMAAGEFLSDPTAMEQLSKSVGPAVRARRNLEVVLSTDVVRGMSGAPKIVAVWIQ